ncbi:MAG: hypothetical protein O2819_07925 [Planctomycetota bacterium]|nr:hypothetical protein [Planctomycetota bacterium]
MNDQEAAVAATVGSAIVAFACVCCIAMFGLQALVCWLIQGAQSRVPHANRRMSPAGVWLLMIPLFSIVWVFLVGIRVPDSIRAARQARGEDVDDCGRRIGVAWAICGASAAVFSLLNIVLILLALAMGELDPSEFQSKAMAGNAIGCVSNILGLASLVLLIIFIVKVRGSSKPLTQA